MTLPHLLFFILINMIWGSMYIAAKIGLAEFPPVFFTALRFAIIAGALVPFIRVPRHQIMPLVRIGLVMGVGMYLSLYYAIYLADNVSAIAVVGQLEVPIAVLLGVLFLQERIGPRRIAGITITFAGAMIIGFDPAMADDLPAVFWITVSATFYAVTMVMVRKMEKIHPLTITVWLSLITAPVLMLVSFTFESGHAALVEGASLYGWGALVYSAVFGSIISHSGMYYLLQRYPISLLAPGTLLAPVFAVAGGVFILGDEMTTRLGIGIILVLGGVYWLNRRSPNTPATP